MRDEDNSESNVILFPWHDGREYIGLRFTANLPTKCLTGPLTRCIQKLHQRAIPAKASVQMAKALS